MLSVDPGVRMPPRRSSATPPYEISPLCRYCAEASYPSRGGGRKPRRSCGDEIRALASERWNFTLPPAFSAGGGAVASSSAGGWWDAARDAASAAAQLHPDGCGVCDPSRCPGGERYWRYDAAAPKLRGAGATHLLPSVPASARVPVDAIADEEREVAWLTSRWAAAKNATTLDYLFEYNPSLIHLPNGVARSLDLSGAGEGRRYYLASFRLSSATECFVPKTYERLTPGQWNAIRGGRNYLGLAVLDAADLAIVPGYDAVVDLEDGLGHFDVGDAERPHLQMAFTDFRIYASRGGRMWLNFNGGSAHIAPFTVTVGGPAENAGPPPRFGGREPVYPLTLPNLHGGPAGLRLTLLGNFSTVWTGGVWGKNYALFQTDEVPDDEFLAEVNIWPRREVVRLRPDAEVIHHPPGDVLVKQFPQTDAYQEQAANRPAWQKSGQNLRKFDIWRREIVEVGNSSETRPADDGVERAVPTVDELWFPGQRVFKEQVHGGACCATLGVGLFPETSALRRWWSERSTSRNGGPTPPEHLLLGVGHSKIQWQPYHRRNPAKAALIPHTQYASFFYAFEPRAPYRIRAASGLFCLGFPGPDEAAVAEGGNPYVRMTYNRTFRLNREAFACPQIHYVSGVVDKIDDDGAVLVSYGINDCVPRVVDVAKGEIVRLLLGSAEGDKK